MKNEDLQKNPRLPAKPKGLAQDPVTLRAKPVIEKKKPTTLDSALSPSDFRRKTNKKALNGSNFKRCSLLQHHSAIEKKAKINAKLNEIFAKKYLTSPVMLYNTRKGGKYSVGLAR